MLTEVPPGAAQGYFQTLNSASGIVVAQLRARPRFALFIQRAPLPRGPGVTDAFPRPCRSY